MCFFELVATTLTCPFGQSKNKNYTDSPHIYLFRVATGQGNLTFLQGQGILQIDQGNFKYQESQGKVRKFHNFGPKYVL